MQERGKVSRYAARCRGISVVAASAALVVVPATATGQGSAPAPEPPAEAIAAAADPTDCPEGLPEITVGSESTAQTAAPETPSCARDADTGSSAAWSVQSLQAFTFGDPDGYDNMRPTENFSGSCFDGSSTWTDGDTICQTDNRDVTAWVAAAEFDDPGEGAIWDTLFDSWTTTALNVRQVTSPSYSGSSETDIIYRGGQAWVPQDGITWCDDADQTCDATSTTSRSNRSAPLVLWPAMRRDTRSG
jgi:hypothetical protein